MMATWRRVFSLLFFIHESTVVQKSTAVFDLHIKKFFWWSLILALSTVHIFREILFHQHLLCKTTMYDYSQWYIILDNILIHNILIIINFWNHIFTFCQQFFIIQTFCAKALILIFSSYCIIHIDVFCLRFCIFSLVIFSYYYSALIMLIFLLYIFNQSDLR